MLERCNKTVRHKIPLENGAYMWIILRHNKDCTNKWREKELVLCWIYHARTNCDASRVMILEYDGYEEFKKFKDAVKKGSSKLKLKCQI